MKAMGVVFAGLSNKTNGNLLLAIALYVGMYLAQGFIGFDILKTPAILVIHSTLIITLAFVLSRRNYHGPITSKG